jgi:uncharacterized protein YfiM (DUF2279 family)
MQFSTPANLLKAASSILIDATSGTDSRAMVMSLTIFSAAGDTIGACYEMRRPSIKTFASISATRTSM